MEFLHFLKQTPIPESDIIYSVYYPGRDASIPTAWETMEASALDAFSLFFTFKRNTTGAQVLFSTISVGTDGWTLGITDSNFLFIEKHSDTSESFIYDNINLGDKNCVCLQRNNETFTVYKYDIASETIEGIQSFSLLDNNIFANEITVCGEVATYPPRFDGVFDQIVLMNQCYSYEYVMALLKGFAAYNLTETPTVSYSIESSTSYFNNSILSSDNAFLTELNTYTIESILDSYSIGEYLLYITGTVTSSSINLGLSLNSGDTYCSGSGLILNWAHSLSSLPTGIGVSDTLYGVVRSIGDGQRIFISNTYSISGAYFGDGKAIYSSYSALQTDTGKSVSYDSSYNTGFYMDGVTSPYSDLVILGTGVALSPTGYNSVSYQNSIDGRFYAPSLGSDKAVYYNGERLESSDFSYDGNFIDVLSVETHNNDYIIYDTSTGFNLIYLGVSNFATGKFYPNASIVFTGHVSYTGIKRDIRSNYLETSSHHLYHSCKIQRRTKGLLFEL